MPPRKGVSTLGGAPPGASQEIVSPDAGDDMMHRVRPRLGRPMDRDAFRQTVTPPAPIETLGGTQPDTSRFDLSGIKPVGLPEDYAVRPTPQQEYEEASGVPFEGA